MLSTAASYVVFGVFAILAGTGSTVSGAPMNQQGLRVGQRGDFTQEYQHNQYVQSSWVNHWCGSFSLSSDYLKRAILYEADYLGAPGQVPVSGWQTFKPITDLPVGGLLRLHFNVHPDHQLRLLSVEWMPTGWSKYMVCTPDTGKGRPM